MSLIQHDRNNNLNEGILRRSFLVSFDISYSLSFLLPLSASLLCTYTYIQSIWFKYCEENRKPTRSISRRRMSAGLDNVCSTTITRAYLPADHRLHIFRKTYHPKNRISGMLLSYTSDVYMPEYRRRHLYSANLFGDSVRLRTKVTVKMDFGSFITIHNFRWCNAYRKLDENQIVCVCACV